jgi:hypothetical protein
MLDVSSPFVIPGLTAMLDATTDCGVLKGAVRRDGIDVPAAATQLAVTAMVRLHHR